MCTTGAAECQNFEGDKPIWCRGVATGGFGGWGSNPPLNLADQLTLFKPGG